MKNDFTCKDVSVVDYTLVPYEQQRLDFDFEVKGARDLFLQSGCVGMVDPNGSPRSQPTSVDTRYLFICDKYRHSCG